MAWRYWHGPAVGLVTSQVCQGYAARLFLSFGKLDAANYILPNGEAERHGEFELTNMESWTEWKLLLKRSTLVDSVSHYRVRENKLRVLVGRRLLSVQIDPCDRFTILRFSGELALTTRDMEGKRERSSHWLLRLSEDDWRPVVLMGTNALRRRMN